MFEPLLGRWPGVTRAPSPSWTAFSGRSGGSNIGLRSDGTKFEPLRIRIRRGWVDHQPPDLDLMARIAPS